MCLVVGGEKKNLRSSHIHSPSPVKIPCALEEYSGLFCGQSPLPHFVHTIFFLKGSLDAKFTLQVV